MALCNISIIDEDYDIISIIFFCIYNIISVSEYKLLKARDNNFYIMPIKTLPYIFKDCVSSTEFPSIWPLFISHRPEIAHHVMYKIYSINSEIASYEIWANGEFNNIILSPKSYYLSCDDYLLFLSSISSPKREQAINNLHLNAHSNIEDNEETISIIESYESESIRVKSYVSNLISTLGDFNLNECPLIPKPDILLEDIIYCGPYLEYAMGISREGAIRKNNCSFKQTVYFYLSKLV